MRTEVDRMVRMVDDLFELSRIHAGVLRLSPQPVALGDVVSEAIAGADSVARARGVRLGGQVDEDVLVTADPAGLSRVVSNLLMNAIRHTPADGVVEISARSVPDGVELVRHRRLRWDEGRGRSRGSSTSPGRAVGAYAGAARGHGWRRGGAGAGHRQGDRRGAPRSGRGGEPRPGLPVPGHAACVTPAAPLTAGCRRRRRAARRAGPPCASARPATPTSGSV